MNGGGAQTTKSGVRLVVGNPTDEELAAVVVVVAALVSAAAAAQAMAQRQTTGRRWNPRAHQMTHQLLGRGPGAWLMSILR